MIQFTTIISTLSVLTSMVISVLISVLPCADQHGLLLLIVEVARTIITVENDQCVFTK